jgi:hypothetical protein
MGELWGTLVPLGVGSALVPIQIVITTMLLRAKTGRVAAVAWLAGMTVVRLGQGLVFGLILGGARGGSTSTGPGTGVSAAKQLLSHPDEDAPPPRWMAMIESVTPARAFGLGAGMLLIGVKFWVFTLAAISAIGEAGLGQGAAIAAFLVFVILAESIHLALIGLAFAMPGRAAAMLDGIIGFLTRYNRVLMVVLGAVFGTWFLVKALAGLGLL